MKTWLFTWNMDRWAWNGSLNGYRELKNDIANQLETEWKILE